MSLIIKKEVAEDEDEETTFGDGRKIPRPMNAFMIYANENRKSMSLLFPKDSNKDISRRLGLSWKRLGREAKNSYFFKAQQMDLEHKRKYPNYVYNPKEARLRKAMRDANRERLIGCNNSMLQRPNARRATGPHSWLQQGSHEEQMMMPIRCQSAAPTSALEPPPPRPPSACFAESVGARAASPAPPSAPADQYMAMTAGGYHRRQHHQQRRPAAPDLEAQGAAAVQIRNHDGYMQPNPLAQLQQQTDMWPGFQNDMRAPRSSPYLLQEPYHHHHHHHHHHNHNQQAPSPMSMPSPHLHHPHVSLTPPQVHHPVVLTPPHSNENVPPATEEGCPVDGTCREYEGKQQQQHLLEQTMQQPLMETNNLQQNQNQNQGYVTSYATGGNQYEKVQEEAHSKKAAPSACQPYPRKPPRPKALPDFNEAFGSTERGRFQSPPDPNSAPNKRLMDFFFEDTGGGAPRFDDFQI